MPTQSYADGQTILTGKYRILRMIGEGASSQVFLAHHTRMGNAPRALKVLRRGIAGAGSTEIEDYRRRFELEAALMEELGRHDGIVQAFDVDVDSAEGGETLLLALEYMPGGSLEDRLAGKALPLPDCARILREIADALRHLHARDVVHRDLKPGNILFDAAGRANIGDLGLAQVPNGLSARTRAFSQWREHPGTPQYMSPEQQSSRAYLTPASDVYALGLIAFEMLTARVARNQPPGTRARALRSDCPAWLDDLIADMLLEDPRQRPWDAERVVERMDAGLAQEASAAQAAQARAREAADAQKKIDAERDARGRDAAAHAERDRTLRAQQAAAEAQARADAERRARDEAARRATQVRDCADKTAAAIAAARWSDAATHARAWLALQPDDAQARAALKLAQDEQANAGNARLRRALLVGGGGAGVLGLGYLLTRPSTLPPAATASPAAPTQAPLRATGAPTAAQPTAAQPTAAPPTAAPPAPTAAPAATRVPSAFRQVSDALVELTLAAGVSMPFVRVPAGEFVMGSKSDDTQAFDQEKPQHRLTLPEYWIGKAPVIVAQFAAFVKATGFKTQAEKDGKSIAWTGSEWKEVAGADWAHPQGPASDVSQKQQHPVNHVSWDDSQAFAKWAGEVGKTTIQLASEAEWEKAARGTDGRTYPWGNEAPDSTRCNFNNNEKDTTPVGKYGARGASPYGCDDMAGNVWEWTRSLWGKDGAKPEYGYPYTDRQSERENTQAGTDVLRVLRGGSFFNVAQVVRCASRDGFNPLVLNLNIGFRVVVARLPSL